ncbi:MAG: DUF58 domain-containing protein [Proteobacteria bacterium]|nr:DUF58 domain-containing protein [Cystobacterineae bacterium]MCL2259242.1 DUF58 domain-containing protein [Cystobacterineae bacterium]MCL2314419.1 DUF58 domain-containing protein [Pseudomonadota bacterium]
MPTLSAPFLAQLATFKLRVKTLAQGVLTGLHKSPLQGQSVEFSEHKEYAPGDELRHLDWKVQGKLDRYFIKRFEHEANTPFVLLVDSSGSMGYGEGGLHKLETAKLLAGAFAWVASKQQDGVGLLSFSQEKPQLLRPQAHANHLGLVLSQLEALKAQGGTYLNAAFETLATQLRRRAVLVVFSDLLDERPNPLPKLLKASKQKHDVVLFHILHTDELHFPFEEPTLFLSMEDERRLEAHPLRLRQSYLEQMQGFLKETQTQCQAANVDYTLVPTNSLLEPVLVRFFAQRKHRRRS